MSGLEKKLSLFTVNMIIFNENPKESKDTLLELISEYRSFLILEHYTKNIFISIYKQQAIRKQNFKNI